ncbi:ParD-like family protein [candidate division KSB1 bacterium]|nr:ParD-like family protein [candidate division KSB1 bacterium]
MSIAVRISDKLIKAAKIQSKVENRSLTGQIEFWAKIGKISEENPDLPYSFIKEILIGLEQLDSGIGEEYRFG